MDFIDLTQAVNIAREHGMKGAFNHALLRVSARGPTWTITPSQQMPTAQDPFLRNGAYEIPALVAGSSGNSDQVNAGGQASDLANKVVRDLLSDPSTVPDLPDDFAAPQGQSIS